MLSNGRSEVLASNAMAPASTAPGVVVGDAAPSSRGDMAAEVDSVLDSARPAKAQSLDPELQYGLGPSEGAVCSGQPPKPLEFCFPPSSQEGLSLRLASEDDELHRPSWLSPKHSHSSAALAPPEAPPRPPPKPPSTRSTTDSTWLSRAVRSLIADAVAPSVTAVPVEEVLLPTTPEDAGDAVMEDDADDGKPASLRCVSCGTPFDCGLRACRCASVAAMRATSQRESRERRGQLLQRLRSANSRPGPPGRGGGNSSVQVIWENEEVAGGSDSDMDFGEAPPLPPLAAATLPELQLQLQLQPQSSGARKRKLSDLQSDRKRLRKEQHDAVEQVLGRQASSRPGRTRGRRARGRPPGPGAGLRGSRGRSRSASRGRGRGRGRGGRGAHRGRNATRSRARASSGSRRKAGAKRGRRAGDRCSECGRAVPKLGWLSMVGRAIKRAIGVGERPFCSTCWRKLPQRRRRGAPGGGGGPQGGQQSPPLPPPPQQPPAQQGSGQPPPAAPSA